MTQWIDEYSEEFSAREAALSQLVDPDVCGGRVLTLLSGPAKAFADGEASSSDVYKSIFTVLERHRKSSPVVEDGANEVRDQYRSHGCNDAVRHCILASAIQVGLDGAIRTLFADLEPLKKYLFGKFGSRAGFQTTEDVWQEATNDIVLSKIQTFKGGGTLISWAKTVIGRETSRKLVRDRETVSIEAAEYDVKDNSTAIESSDEVRAVWDAAWSGLTDDEQFVWTQLSRGWKGEDIAGALGVHPGNVSRKMKSGAEKLRQAFLAAGESADSLRPFIQELMESSAEATA